MLKKILTFGLAAGLLAGVPLFALVVMFKGPPPKHGMAVGYVIMLIALSLVFVAIRRQRADQGGVIRFWPAFGMGLAVSLVAGLVYAATWEVTLAVSKLDFGTEWARIHLDASKANGLPEAELTKLADEMEHFKAMYANPLVRFAMTFFELFPVGIFVSLVSAGLLRNSRFMARQRP